MKTLCRWVAVVAVWGLFFPAAGLAASSGMMLYHVGQVELSRLVLPSPLTFCGEVVDLTDPDVRERLERELLISLDNTDDIIMWLKRANRYFPHIEQVLAQSGLPDDIKYVAIAESSLRAHAASGKGAVGYWQFIEGTALKYGLIVTREIDERRNVYAATRAAALYFQDLYAMFGSWTLSAAAYNMGEDGLKSEILIQKVNDYYRLHLFLETQRYVFRILAAKIIISNPGQFGYTLSRMDLYPPRTFEEVTVSADEPVPLQLVADAAGVTFKSIKDLNPQLRGYTLPAGSWTLSIPDDVAAGFTQRFETLRNDWVIKKESYVYTVKAGDHLTGIAARFDVPLRALYIWNQITDGNRIMPGDRLYIFTDDFKQRLENAKPPTLSP